MSRVVFTISYGIRPDVRDEYLAHIGKLKHHLTTVAGKNYAVYELKGKKNQFQEMFITESEEEFDALEDNLDPESEAMIAKLEEYVDGEGMKYTTVIERV